ncbi:MAG: dihydrofolate reductase [Kiritimatiellae bacterium]|nr:dihydrofolate reductase [Kiritimatiellia bacterium]
MKVSIVVAIAANGVIGKGGQLPWYISEDLRFFKKVTMGKPIVMGRKTWESIGKPLPGRLNIVVTRQRDFSAPGAIVVHSLAAALEHVSKEEEVAIIGGAQLYGETIPLADIIHLTEVNASYDGDTFFPKWERSEWREVSREDHAGSPGYSFVRLERKYPG